MDKQGVQFAIKKNSYSPIMLTSKSMVPVRRRNKIELSKSNDHKEKHKINNEVDSGVQMSSITKRISYFQNNINEFILQNQRQMDSDQDEVGNIVKNRYQDNQNKDSKITTQILNILQSSTTMYDSDYRLKYKFRQNFQNRKVNLINIDELKDLKTNHKNEKSTSNFFHSQTFSEFPKQNLKIQKIIDPQRIFNLKNSKRSKFSNNFSKFLFDHYLKIKKMNPKTHRERLMDIRQLTLQHHYGLSERDVIIKKEQKKSEQIEKQKKYTLSLKKRMDLRQKKQKSVQDKIVKIKKNLKMIADNDQTNKKQYFVFGIQNNNKGNSYSAENSLNTKLYIYRDMLFKINYTNGIYVKWNQQIEKPYKFYVGMGNNSQLLKGILRRRFWWKAVDKQSQLNLNQVNFVWTQLKVGNYFNKLQNFTKSDRKEYKNIQNLKNEGSIIEDLQEQDGNQKLMMGEDLQYWKHYYSKYKKIQIKYTNRVYSKRYNNLLSKKPITYIEDSGNIKLHNHFECNQYLGNKKALFYYLTRYYRIIDIDPFTKIPITFHISKGVDDLQYQNFLQKYQQFQQLKRKKEVGDIKNIWIMKPGQCSNRGKGITVCSSLDDIKIRLKAKEKNPINNQLRTFILQKYIQRPLLYKKRKFDIRHYMLMTCFNGKFKGYWYKEGYLRTTSTEYSIKNTKDLFTHLTNDAVQKFSSDYGKFQKGNKVTYADFQKYMQNLPKQQRINEKYEGYNFYSQTLPQMQKLALDSMRATFNTLSPHRKNQTFQLFGLDFMLDQQLSVYLIQVNTNPCLETSCPLLLKLISALVENVYKICVDPFFPPPLDWPTNKKFQFGENPIQQNKFNLIFDENVEGPYLEQLLNKQKIQIIGGLLEDDDEYQDEGNQWNQQL